MNITQRRVTAVEDGNVTYERVDEPWLVIYRTIRQHTEAMGKPPVVGDVIEFETYNDYDGAISLFKVR